MGPLEKLRESLYMRGRLPHFTLNRLIDAIGWNLFSPFWLKHIQNQGAPITAIGGVEALYKVIRDQAAARKDKKGGKKDKSGGNK